METKILLIGAGKKAKYDEWEPQMWENAVFLKPSATYKIQKAASEATHVVYIGGPVTSVTRNALAKIGETPLLKMGWLRGCIKEKKTMPAGEFVMESAELPGTPGPKRARPVAKDEFAEVEVPDAEKADNNDESAEEEGIVEPPAKRAKTVAVDNDDEALKTE
ncbi:MAG: hypothetical protein MHM6MM_006729 [Cercozoa sp. M6MM]